MFPSCTGVNLRNPSSSRREDLVAIQTAAAPSTSAMPNSSTAPPLFPWKLHFVLDEAARLGQEDIISWMPYGASFKVHNKPEFEKQILPTYFNTTKFKSFQRSLNLWGFHAFTKGPSKGASHHPLFRRGMPELCRGMTRERIKRTSSTGESRPYPVSMEALLASSNKQEATISTARSSPSLAAAPYLPSIIDRQQVGNFDLRTVTPPTPTKNFLAPRKISNIMPLVNFYASNASTLPVRGSIPASTPLIPGSTIDQVASQTILLEEMLRRAASTPMPRIADQQARALLAAQQFQEKLTASTKSSTSAEAAQARHLLAFAATALDQAAKTSLF